MLIDFSVKNFKIFKDDVIFSMVPDKDINEMDYSLNSITVEDANFKGLTTALIYGPNAIGKTSLINALTLLKKIILKGSLNINSKNSNKSQISQFPNIYNSEKQDLEFEICFLNNGYFYSYELHIDAGIFGEPNNIPIVTYKKLIQDDNRVYERINNNIRYINKGLLQDSFKNVQDLENSITVNLNSQALLFSFIQVLLKSGIIENFIDWFENKLIIVSTKDNSYATHSLNIQSEKLIDSHEIKHLIELLNSSSEDFVFSKNHFSNNTLSCNTNPASKTESNYANFLSLESAGIQKFLKIFPLIIKALNNGATVVIDELETSLHSPIVMSLINVFHDDTINIKNSQLIMTTHNPIYMNQKLVRRDEIYLLDHSDKENIEIYSLSDFPAIKPDDNFMESYLQGQYGAINHINLNELIGDIINSNN